MTGSSTARTVAGLLLGVVGLGSVAAVVLTARRPAAAPATGATSGPKPGTGPALGSDGRILPVGMVSSIPQSVGYDTGALDYTYNAPGWDYYPIGVMQ